MSDKVKFIRDGSNSSQIFILPRNNVKRQAIEDHNLRLKTIRIYLLLEYEYASQSTIIIILISKSS